MATDPVRFAALWEQAPSNALAPPRPPAPLPPGQHTLFEAGWFFTDDSDEVHWLKSQYARSLIRNPSADDVLSIEEVEQLHQAEDWMGLVLLNRLISGEVFATYRLEGEISWRQLAASEWLGATISVRRNFAEINSAVLKNVLVSQGDRQKSSGQPSRKPSQEQVNAWVTEFMQNAVNAGRSLPKRDQGVIPVCRSVIGGTDIQVKAAFKSLPEHLKRKRGARDR